MKKFFSAILLMTAMVFSVSTFVSCNDQLAEIEKVQGQVGANADAIDDLEDAIDGLTERLEAAEADLTAAEQELQTLKNTVATDAELEAAIAGLATKYATVEALNNAVNTLNTLKSTYEATIPTLATKEEVAAADKTLQEAIDVINGVLGTAENKTAITNLAKTLGEINTQITALETFQELAEKYLDWDGTEFTALADLKKELQDADKKITDLIGEVEEGKTVVGLIKANAKEITDIWAELNNTETGLDKINERLDDIEGRLNDETKGLDAIWAKIDAVNSALNTRINGVLKSIVFVPQVYVGGVESAKYTFATGDYLDAEKATENEPVTGAENTYFPKNAKKDWKPAATDYNSPKEEVMYFHLNPADADLTGASWEFLNATPATKADDVATAEWIKSEKKNGLLEVTYRINNPENLYNASKEKATADKKINVAALQATFTEEGKTTAVITSDYLGFDPSTITFDALAYLDATIEAEECDEENGAHLYENATDAITKTATVKWHFNGGEKNLKEMINIHYTADGEELEMTLDDAKNYYGLDVTFESFAYLTGSNKTDESAYLAVTEGGIVTPRYVKHDTEGQRPVVIPSGEAGNTTEGRSAIGREPVVLVTLHDGQKVVLAGYIKLEITEKNPEPLPDAVLVINKTDKSLPYICTDQNVTVTWDDMSAQVLEKLGMTKTEFTEGYNFTTGKTFVKGTDFTVVDDNAKGTITESENAGALTNDALTFTLTKAQIDAIGTEDPFTLYVKYTSTTLQPTNVYVGITVKFAEKPVVSAWGNKVEKYWYPQDVALEDRNIVRMNVLEPSTTALKTETYVKDLDEYFVNGGSETVAPAIGPKFTLGYDETDYAGVDFTVEYSYVFSTDNDKQFEGKTMAVADNGLTLKWDNAEIAKINATTGAITYQDNATAKKFLNLFSHDEEVGQFAVVEVKTTYCTNAENDCEIKIPVAFETGVSNKFNVRFLRPLDIIANEEEAVLVDAESKGAEVSIGKFFTAVDWRDVPVLTYDETDGAEAYTDKGVNLYNYYGIYRIKVDIPNATTNLYDGKTFQPLNELIELKLYWGDGTNTPIEVGKQYDYNLNIGVVNENGNDVDYFAYLNGSKIVYHNNSGNTQDFTIKIPVYVKYVWGEVKLDIPVKVTNTMAN